MINKNYLISFCRFRGGETFLVIMCFSGVNLEFLNFSGDSFLLIIFWCSLLLHGVIVLPLDLGDLLRTRSRGFSYSLSLCLDRGETLRCLSRWSIARCLLALGECFPDEKKKNSHIKNDAQNYLAWMRTSWKWIAKLEIMSSHFHSNIFIFFFSSCIIDWNKFIFFPCPKFNSCCKIRAVWKHCSRFLRFSFTQALGAFIKEGNAAKIRKM